MSNDGGGAAVVDPTQTQSKLTKLSCYAVRSWCQDARYTYPIIGRGAGRRQHDADADKCRGKNNRN